MTQHVLFLDQVLQSLMEAESTFHSVLQNGIETYLDPLQSVVSETIHTTVFCNLKEVRLKIDLYDDVMSKYSSLRCRHECYRN